MIIVVEHDKTYVEPCEGEVNKPRVGTLYPPLLVHTHLLRLSHLHWFRVSLLWWTGSGVSASGHPEPRTSLTDNELTVRISLSGPTTIFRLRSFEVRHHRQWWISETRSRDHFVCGHPWVSWDPDPLPHVHQ